MTTSHTDSFIDNVLMLLLKMESKSQPLPAVLSALTVSAESPVRSVVTPNDGLRTVGDFVGFYNKQTKAGRYILAIRAGASLSDVDLSGKKTLTDN